MDAAHVRAEGIRVLPPIYPLTAMFLGFVLQQVAPVPTPAPWVRAIGVAVLALGVLLFAWAIVTQYRRGTDPNPWKDTTVLVTHGVYAWSRNPIYLADLMLQAGVGLVWWPWALAMLPVTWSALRFLVIRKEERFLQQRFGAAYEAYAARTARWIGPPRSG